jgi:hypothetical protein
VSVGNSVGQIQLDLGVNYNQFNKQLGGIAGNATSMVGSAFSKLGLIMAAAFAVKKVIDFGAACIDLASNLNEVQNVVDVTFGGMSKQIDAFSKSALLNFGMSELSAKKYTSTMGAMLKSSGITGNALLQMSEGVAALAGDMASFYNLSQDEAFSKIRAGIAGEVEPLRQLGINMTVANMEAYALSKGIKKQYQEMSQAEQALLRYNYLLSASKDAQGDFVRTSGSWANQTRLLNEQWKIFQTTMGQGFMNILTPVVQGLNWLIQKLQIAAQYFKAFTELLFGAQQSASGAASSADDASGAIGSVGDSAKDTASKIKGSVAGFDELNMLAQNTASSMEDAAGSIGGVDFGDAEVGNINVGIDTSGVDDFKVKMDEMKEKISNVLSFIKREFGPSIQEAIEIAKPTLQQWGVELGKTFGMFSKLSEPIKNWIVDSLIPMWKRQIPRLATVFAGISDSLLKVFTTLRDALYPIIEWFVTNGLPMFSEIAEGGNQIFMALYEDIKLIFDTLWTGVVDPALKGISKAFVETLDVLKRTWDTYGQGLIDGVTGVFESIGGIFTNLWEDILQPIWNTICTTLSDLWENHLKGMVEQLSIFIAKLVQGITDIWNGFVAPIVNFLIDVLGPIVSNVFGHIGEIFETVGGTISDVLGGVFEALGGLVDFIAGVFTLDFERAWNGIKTFFSGLWDGIVGILKGAVNLIVDILNILIDGVNLISGTIGDVIGVNMRIPHIPKLAEGGLVQGPTLAMVGDNTNANTDPEVVAPLSKLESMLAANSGNQEMVSILRAILDLLGNKEPVVLKVGETELARTVVKVINNLQRQTGQTLIMV